jgi:hypothetical protein
MQQHGMHAIKIALRIRDIWRREHAYPIHIRVGQLCLLDCRLPRKLKYHRTWAIP